MKNVLLTLFLILITISAFAAVPEKAATSPKFDRLLILDLDSKRSFTAQEIYGGLDGFLAEQIPPHEVTRVDTKNLKNTFKDTNQNTYLGLTSFDQLRSMDSDRNFRLDIYDPLYTRLVIVHYDGKGGGFYIKKLSDVGIISISIPAVPTLEEFHAKKFNGYIIDGQVISFPKAPEQPS